MKTTTENKKSKPLFETNSKGDILIVGSGKFFQAQKEKYASFEKPYKKLYEDQVMAVCKNLTKENFQLLSFSKK